MVARWLGTRAGWQGIVLARLGGAVMPDGSYVVSPLVAALYQAGAGLRPAVTLVTSWATLALFSVTFELPLVGWRFTAVRWGLVLAFPMLTGGAAQLIFGGQR